MVLHKNEALKLHTYEGFKMKFKVARIEHYFLLLHNL